MTPILECIISAVSADGTISEEHYFLASGFGLIEYVLKDGHILHSSNILDGKHWAQHYWPSYNRKTGDIYFQAVNVDEGKDTYIYVASLLKGKLQPRKIIKGSKPSLSLDGNLLAYYQHPSKLWVFDLETKKVREVASDIVNHQPVVWISNQHLLYRDLKNQLVSLDIATEGKQLTGYYGINPGALSPDGKKVLCGSYDGRQILLYFPETNEMKVIKKAKHLSMGSSFVWSLDGKSFLYTRQAWSSMLKFEQTKGLFYCTLDTGEEACILGKIALFGGIAVPPGK